MAAKSHPRDLGRQVIASISTIRRSAAAQGSHASKRPGSHPARYVPAARVGRAKAWLQRADRPLERIAERSGSGSVDALQRAFATCIGASPRDYRARFGQPRRANPKTSVSGNATRLAPAESCTMHRI
ncbi:helix-turn-helix domain protein [Burkholderia cepacia]|nr:helix-turn-helix domain protein [Burkholderia cepacia]